jgi:ATP-dependent Clp protease adaptor protein ClpS
MIAPPSYSAGTRADILCAMPRLELSPPETQRRPRRPGEGPGDGEPTHVIVLNDNHNTFEHVALTLAQYIPATDYARGMALAERIHRAGSARVWSGHRELAELYWDQLKGAGLTMAPLA